MKHTLDQAKTWASVRFTSKLVDHYWESTWWGHSSMSSAPSDWDYEYNPTEEEKLSILESTRREILWATKKKFGKKFGTRGYKELVKFVEGLH